MRIVAGGPAEVVGADLLPAAIFVEACFGADEVAVKRQASGERFVHPHANFFGTLGAVAPVDHARGVASCNIRRELSVHDGVADAGLQGASPDGRVLVGAPLVVALEPLREFAEAVEVGSGMHVAAEVGEEEAVGLFLLGDGVVFLPELDEAVVEGAPVGRRVGGGQLAADSAVALWQAAERRPSVGVETIYIVERVYLAHDGGDVVVHVAGEHAGLEQARLFAVELRGSVLVAHGPLGMRLERVAPVQIGAHAGNHVHVALLRGANALAEEIAAIEIFPMAMERNLRGIESENPSHADEDDLRAGGVPVVGPLLDVHDGGIVLGHVALAYTTDLLLPGLGSGVERRQARGKRHQAEVRGGCCDMDIGSRCQSGLKGVERSCERKRRGGGLEEVAAIDHGELWANSVMAGRGWEKGAVPLIPPFAKRGR